MRYFWTFIVSWGILAAGLIWTMDQWGIMRVIASVFLSAITMVYLLKIPWIKRWMDRNDR